MKKTNPFSRLKRIFSGRGEPYDTLMDRQVSIGSHSLHVFCLGRGSPPLVIDTGLGEICAAWQPLQRRLAELTRVFAYDRAGYGESAPGSLPRHSRVAAEDLRLLLEKAGVEPPFLLLGHSLGALNLQVFAGLYPQDTAGLLLLDPPPLEWICGRAFPELAALAEEEVRKMKAAAEEAAHSHDAQQQAKAAFYTVLASEQAELLNSSARQAEALASFGDLPLFVLASTQPNPNFGAAAEAFQSFWIEQSRGLAAKSTRGEFILAPNSSHHIHLDAPDLVVNAVQRALALVRS